MRFTVHESRTIHIEWHPERESFEFRLMYGRGYITPKLWLTPLDWYGLAMGKVLNLEHPGRRGSEVWLMIRREGGKLLIHPRRELIFPIGAYMKPDWEPVPFQYIYDLATRARGAKPETGWERVHEEALERERESWGPA